MKNLRLTLVLALLSCAMGYAQRTPTHPLDILDVTAGAWEFLDEWEPGTPPPGVSTIDDQFYIGRQRPLPRIVDGDYQVHSDVSRDRKMNLWVPLEDPSVTWHSLPRYCFEGDNFSLWSYIDIHGNWAQPWFRSTAGITDAAHKNGVEVGCCWTTGWTESVNLTGTNENSQRMQKILSVDEEGDFLYSEKIVRLMKYYGIDGLGINSEFLSNSETLTRWRDFIKDCHKKGEEIGWDFNLYWYDGTSDTGSLRFDRGIGSHNQLNFGDKDNIVADMMFFNYNWSNSILSSSVKKATSMGRNSYDIYAGFDIQQYGYKEHMQAYWTSLKNNNVSIGFWGAHSQSLIHQSSTDDGTADIAIQKAYLLKQELTFSGGNRNPAVLPAINKNCTLSNADLKGFHGLATFLTAKSTIQQVPFVTRFNLGNGLKFYNEGEVAFDHKWYNLNTQDYLPTWRFWTTDKNDAATTANLSSLIQSDLVFDEAYFGGSCLSVHGATPFSRVKLFKTLLTVQPSYTISLTYKLPQAGESRAKVFIAKRDALTDYKEVSLPAAEKAGEWQTFTTTLDQLGIQAGDQISMIGLSFEDTPADYNLLVGELALVDPSADYQTATPAIKEVEICRGRYNALDFKIRYASREETGEQKTYNDEVGTWYYEIYFQQQDQPVQLLTATTSWAAYVVDCPLVSGYEGRKGRFGVRAVAPDGKSGSEIVWTEYQDIPYDEVLTDVVVDKAVVKPGETFTVGLVDDMSKPAKEWRVADPLTGEVLVTANNSQNLTTSISKEGVYDLYFVDEEGNESVTRGFVQITPEATGSVPQVLTFEADKEAIKAGESVNFNYTSRDGEGKVSRALRIDDPNMLMVPGDIQIGKTYSYALWFKADKFSHDKQGTNLINKNSIYDSWPHNNWGDLWVTIRPAIANGTVFEGHTKWGMTMDHPANEVSFNAMGWGPRDGPCEFVMSSGYQVPEGVWTHVVVTSDNLHHKLYFNGKKVADYTFDATDEFRPTRREDMTDTRINKTKALHAPIFIGGGNVYKAGFVGYVDEFQIWDKELSDEEVLQAMKGYDEGSVPEGLQGYYTFETLEADGTFKNLGHGGEAPAKMVATVDSGGENTSGATYENRDADNSGLGYPGITGSIDITTSAEWNLPGASVVADGKTAAATYATAGKFNAGVKLANLWGEANFVESDFIEVTGEVGITQFLSENQGDSVEYYSLDGRRISESDTKQPGVYVVRIVKDGKTLRAAKYIRR